jgi:hypothetical protein
VMVIGWSGPGILIGFSDIWFSSPGTGFVIAVLSGRSGSP